MDIEREGDYKEKRIVGINGCIALPVALALLLFAIASFIAAPTLEMWIFWLLAPVAIVFMFIILSGLIVINPNFAVVCQFCGKYVGTVRNAGYWWVNPFYSKM
jgi:hypothetical protein